ncbi:hypothetical protein NDU88_002540 [Pleurodeles waltl]|uniref:Uncharacterized protein n=1 Tax=Pleurodeles waltl TaxID=8319 RepID=A0AAV7W0Y1_PLEWA|nr:hypothetical protein NDU88_002540 [Pleurodeles waltl]
MIGGAGEELLHQLRLKQYNLRALAEQQARAYATASQCRLYDVGDKASRLLAWLDKPNQECSCVRIIRTKEGTTCESSESIVEAFAVYYEDVYASVSQMTEEDCSELLRDIQLPVVSESERGDLEAELTEEEVMDALRALQSGKAAGPNGLPAELFKCLGGTLTKHMLAMFKEVRDDCRWISGLRRL